MKRFSSIAPQMKEIQEKYANDREKMQAELIEALQRRRASTR